MRRIVIPIITLLLMSCAPTSKSILRQVNKYYHRQGTDVEFYYSHKSEKIVRNQYYVILGGFVRNSDSSVFLGKAVVNTKTGQAIFTNAIPMPDIEKETLIEWSKEEMKKDRKEEKRGKKHNSFTYKASEASDSARIFLQ